MKFESLCKRSAAIEAESGDLETVSLVAALLSESDEDLSTITRFIQGRVFPAWSSETLDIGTSLCHVAIARAAGPNVRPEDIENRLAERGEIGAVAESYDFGGQQGLAAFGAGGSQGRLTVSEVDSELRSLAKTSGSGSQDRKLDLLFGLFTRCSPIEARYLARIVLSEMRIGVGEGAVRDAIADAFSVPADTVERALQVTNDYGHVARVAREDGADGLTALQLEIGRPVQAMLAQAGTAAEGIDTWGEAIAETKFDGARVQVHYDGTSVSLFSRNMDDVTDPLPEIVEFVSETATVPCILDGEVIAIDENGDPLPFQAVLRRFRRKHDIAKMRNEVTLELNAFDCLHADGVDLLDEPVTERHATLRSVLDGSQAVSETIQTDSLDKIAVFETQSLEAGHEGIMLKDPAAVYSPGNRGQHWLKRKPDIETLDLVVTGAEWGEGRRANHIGTFLVSVRDGDSFAPIGKVATGITDAQLEELTTLCEPHILSESGQSIDLSPAVVFEVGYEEIQQSPTYASGYALRFPRFVAVRDDKTPETADSLDRVDRLAESQ
ncbi:ATP-dependent DNA ligase [Halorubraceae archaeon YAN]|nr:ATP-dependent DNA ligase [Halorubraceae archaeon YAN]